jgi:hypothetical protein
MTIFTSDFQTYSAVTSELLVDRVSDNVFDIKQVNALRYDAQEQFISNVIPKLTLIDHNTTNKTHITVTFEEGQLQVGDKFKVELN